MSDATDILRSYVRLVGRFSGAGSVALYVPPGVSGEREILIADGSLAPVAELADTAAAAEVHGRLVEHAAVEAPFCVASRTAGGVLYRIPLRGGARPEEPPPGRRRPSRGHPELTVWIGLRFEPDPSGNGRDLLWFATAIDALSDEPWWESFLGLAAAFAAHTRTVSRTLIDQVTELPDRAHFQVEVEAALAHVAETRRPAALLLLGPDDFAWVNERLDRRSGDHVLREVAVVLRAGLRGEDHVARYGGATFGGVLLDSSGDDGRVVAENVVARLSEHRYHGGTLRLEFSAGVAVADPAEGIAAQELIRRADQALSAARRGNAGCVRVWEKGSDVEHVRSLDRLQGIFTGDKSKDYRNMRLLLDSVAVVAAATDPVELASRFCERLFETLHVRRAGVLERVRSGGLELLGGLQRHDSGAGPLALREADLALVERACRERDFVSEPGPEAEEPAVCALPLLLQDRCLGGIVIEVASSRVSFEGSDRRLLDALASEMAVALDRARLLERDRERERAEKERLEAEVTDLRRFVHGSRLAYRSAAMESLLATVRKIARTDTTVLITGESGTGKEMLAHTVHELSNRHEKSVVVVDCSAISPSLIESELFGHEKGAFTGAHARKIGRLAQADGATVFLDEIGELPLDLQGKLLRFVQEKQFTPVGGVTPRTVDVRIVAATNANLKARVGQGRFREDLFHRLNVVRLEVPPLRERREDIVHLANIFLQQFAALYRRPAHHFTARAERELESYAWPGNVRELQNLVLTSVLFCDAPEVDVVDLQGFGAAKPPLAAAPADVAPAAVAEPQPAMPKPPLAGPDAVQTFRQALSHEIAAALAGGTAPAPIGKWLAEDLILTADRMSEGIARRGADLLGIPETTYRRQLQAATRNRAAGLVVRSPRWPALAETLEDFVRARRGDADVC
ncbi:MAG TPA: sigma 54-interacting transcriptional regulator, partial [Vicinamibacteria bacterium]